MTLSEEERLDNFMRLRTPVYAMLYAALILGAAAGAVFFMLRYGASDQVRDYIGSAAAGMGSGSSAAAVRSLADRIFTAALFFVCCFVRPGAAVIAAETARRGFVSAFTSAAFIRYYGAKGVLFSACMMPQLLLFVAAILMFGSVNAAAALSRAAGSKKFWRGYIFFFAAALSIFCASALAEGFLTTTFMRLAAAWIE